MLAYFVFLEQAEKKIQDDTHKNIFRNNIDEEWKGSLNKH